MKIDRLLGITIYLLNHQKTPAKMLANRFEVSIRTILRDIDTLCLAGIPVVSSLGMNGGYEISEGFQMERQIAGQTDYKYIISALQALSSAYNNEEVTATLEKMQSLAKNKDTTILMDLSIVHENRDTNQMLFVLNKGIQKKHIIEFEYTNGKDEKKWVEVEPVATIYKWYHWYLIGYNDNYQDYRMYKVVRIDHLKITQKENLKMHKVEEVTNQLQNQNDDRKRLHIHLQCKAKIKTKCREYLHGKIIKEYENGDFEYEAVVPEEETFWYGVILSFGADVKVLGPKSLIRRVVEDCSNTLKIYKIEK